jgi:cellulose synthase/poly-beta-1,6-N-acetylglucosamine synthase-like glycosyltransferase
MSKSMENPDIDSQTPSGPVCEDTNGVNYETLSMIKTDTENHTFMPCGFLKNGQIRPIYGNSTIGKLKRYHHNQGTNPKLMTCITLYNEDIEEFKFTMRGVLQNYEVMCQDPHINMKKNDFFVVLCCDGLDKIPQTFIDFLSERKALDLNLLREKGFADYDEASGRYTMKPIEDFMEPGQESYPNNLLHMFGVTLDDFGVTDNDYFRGRKINFIFALKHVNNGKLNSYKWLFQGLAKYLNPQYIQKLDVGTRPGDYSMAKLYKHLDAVQDCGGCCAEVVIDVSNKAANESWSAYFVTLL